MEQVTNQAMCLPFFSEITVNSSSTLVDQIDYHFYKFVFFYCVLTCCAPLHLQTNNTLTDVVMVHPLEWLVLDCFVYSVSPTENMFLQHITTVLFPFEARNDWSNCAIRSVLHQCSVEPKPIALAFKL